MRDDTDGPGVVGAEDGMGGGENDAERCRLGMTSCGLACQKGDGWGRCRAGCGAPLDLSAREGGWSGGGMSVDLCAVLTRFLSRSTLSRSPRSARSFSRSCLSRLSLFLSFLACSSSGVCLGMGTPLSRLVRTSRWGRGSKLPARTEVAVRRRLEG